jgi:hypothetical protein
MSQTNGPDKKEPKPKPWRSEEVQRIRDALITDTLTNGRELVKEARGLKR